MSDRQSQPPPMDEYLWVLLGIGVSCGLVVLAFEVFA
jgi:hypothetical protein